VAGVQQHDIPQSVLRGFRVPGGSKKESKTWRYEKGVAPQLVLIKDEVNGAHFYSEPSLDGSTTLDDAITDYERSFDRLFRALKYGPVGTPVDGAGAAEVVAHLTIRNAHFRQTFTAGAQNLLGRANDLFFDEAGFRTLLGVDRDTPSARSKQLLDEHLTENPGLAALGLPRPLLYQMAHAVLKQQFGSFFKTQTPIIQATLNTLADKAPLLVREGHNKSLGHGLAPDGRVGRMKALDWRVMSSLKDAFVLPDCVALGADDKSGLKPLIVADLDKTVTILMPLSLHRMLVGTVGAAAMPCLDAFNASAAASSHTCFYAARSDETFACLAPRIGEMSEKFLDHTLDGVFDEVMKSRAAS
jgi:hypothetical protein